jgi:ADP-ribosyl-[dinitrogen reductase] hydrolase
MKQSREDRIRGVLAGQAVADALGAPYEFGAGTDQPEYGRGVMGFDPGEYTDDTQQAVMVAVAISRMKSNERGTLAELVAAGLLIWYRSSPKDVGAATQAVLGRAFAADDVLSMSKSYGEWLASKPTPPGFLPGVANGSLMRTGPVALAHLGDREAIAKAAREVSDVTHYDPSGYTGDACAIWSVVIDMAIEHGKGLYLPTALGNALGYVPAERREYWAGLVNEAMATEDGTDLRPGNGSALGALKGAVWALSHAHDYLSAIQNAVSIGGDTDTVAAITGQLAGAVFGSSGIPQELRDGVHGWPAMNGGQLGELALAAAGVPLES